MPNTQGRKNETSQNLASVRGNNDTYDQPYRVGRDHSSTLSSEDLRAQSCGGTCPRLHKVFLETPGLEGISPFSPGSFLFSSFFILTVSAASLGLPLTLGFLGHRWRRGKGKVTVGEIPACSRRGLARPLPQFLGARGQLLSLWPPCLQPRMSSRSEFGSKLAPCHPPGSGKRSARLSPAPEGGRPMGTRAFPNPGKP